MHDDLLFEIGTEELPAGYIGPALEFMAARMAAALADNRLGHGEIYTCGTPRRLGLIVRGLAARQPDWREEVTGPPRKAAFDADGNPTRAAAGFAARCGVAVEDLRVVDTPKGEYLAAVVEHRGRDTADILEAVLADILGRVPFPKSMRWGAGPAHFARPVRWITARFADRVIPCRMNEVESGAHSRGHRFTAPGPVPVRAADYLETLRRAGVVADIGERRRMIAEQAERAAEAAGGRLLPDDALLDLVANLVEMPHAVAGRFDEKFLELPREVLITSMREHQKYFAVVDAGGGLMARFVAVNNIDTGDDAAAVRGHERVLRARLEDALFFFREDGKRPLADLVPRLDGVVFQAGLGTMREKSGRMAELAAWLCDRLAPEKKDVTARAATLAKADLLTEMVGEFPSLQGVMGREYARRSGEPGEVCLAIGEHYMPVRAGAGLPSSVPGAIVGIADRIDTIAACFGTGKQPSGNTDPFGLRRLAIGLIHIISEHGFDIPLADLLREAVALLDGMLTEPAEETVRAALGFIRGRYANERAAAFSANAVEAVVSTAFDSITDCDRRLAALAAAGRDESFAILAGSFKRVRNILKGNQADADAFDPALAAEEAEGALHRALAAAEDAAAPLLAAGDYQGAMRVFLGLKDPIDTFFDQVMVMAEDERVRANRLSLMARVARLFLRIGDFSKMSS
jgi:glycyl-tRNA synthetase beta chain